MAMVIVRNTEIVTPVGGLQTTPALAGGHLQHTGVLRDPPAAAHHHPGGPSDLVRGGAAQHTLEIGPEPQHDICYF